MEIKSDWQNIKVFYTANKPVAQMNYIDLIDSVHIWIEFRKAFLTCKLDKLNDEYQEFLTYKSACNVNEAEKVRVTNCKIGRKLHDRYITFYTAKSSNNMDNTDYNDESFGDTVLTMRDVNKQITTVEADCKETWLDFEPNYDYEVSSGYLYVPASVISEEWEAHIIGVPDIPKAQGGCVNFIANPHLKWNAGEFLFLDSALNPAELKYSPYHTNKIRVIIKHPLGVQEKLQLNIKIFR